MTDRARAVSAMREFLEALGHHGEDVDPTAVRVTDAYVDELLAGYGVDVDALIQSGSERVGGPVDPVVLSGITTATVCPHHLLVANGTALLAYEPGDLVLGLGTAARLVDAYSRRFTLQEQIAGNVADALMRVAGARGAFCRLSYDHNCLRSRGARQAGAEVTTWAARGTFSDPQILKLVLGPSVLGRSEGGSSQESAARESEEDS